MSWINSTPQPTGADVWQAGAIGADAPPFFAGGGNANGLGAYGGGADGYRPAWWRSGASSGTSAPAGTPSTNGILAQIMGLLQQLTGGSAGAGYGAAQPGSATFANATLSSTGDPHLALTGTMENPNGGTTQVNDHYDNMGAQRDLFSTDDFGDGFRVATTPTTPNANGVTYNATATATMDHGRDRVSMGPGGTVRVTSNGAPVALAAGGSVTLGGGEVVSESAGGSVSISEQNAAGEALTTTFSDNGSGVDVNATASGGVTLGGSLVRNAVLGAG